MFLFFVCLSHLITCFWGPGITSVLITSVELKQVQCQTVLWLRFVYSESAENCNQRSVTIVSHLQVPPWQRKVSTFIGRRRKLWGLSKQRAFSLAEPLLWEEEKSFFLGSVIPTGVRDPLSGLPTLFNWSFYLLIFYISLSSASRRLAQAGTQDVILFI